MSAPYKTVGIPAVPRVAGVPEDPHRVVGRGGDRGGVAVLIGDRTLRGEVDGPGRSRRTRPPVPGRSHMEGLILDLYQERTSRKIPRGRVLESRRLPGSARPWTPRPPTVRSRRSGRTRTDGMRESRPVILQVTHQMAVTGHRVADVAVLRREGFEVHEVPLKRISGTPSWAGDHSSEHLQQREPPPPDGSESARRAISRLYPEPVLGMMESDAEIEFLVRLITDGRGRVAVLEAEVESLRNASGSRWGSMRESRVPASRSPTGRTGTHRRSPGTSTLGPWSESSGNSWRSSTRRTRRESTSRD